MEIHPEVWKSPPYANQPQAPLRATTELLLFSTALGAPGLPPSGHRKGLAGGRKVGRRQASRMPLTQVPSQAHMGPATCLHL